MNYTMHDIIRQRIGKEETTRENTRLIYFLQEELTYFIHLLHTQMFAYRTHVALFRWYNSEF